MTVGRFVALAVLVSAPLSGQDRPLDSGVRRWREFAVTAPSSSQGRTIVSGATTDLAYLKTELVTDGAKATSHSAARHDDLEELLIVKDGRLRVSVNGLSRVLGPGSVVVVMPGDLHDVASVSRTAATYYRFAYRAKAAADSMRAKRAGGSFMVDWKDIVLQPTGTGGVRRVFDRATAMFDRFEMHVSTLNAGLTNHAAHSHGAEEVVVMRRGDVRMLIGETQQGAAAGDLIFLASKVLHSLDNTGKGPAEYFAFQWQ